MMKLLVLSNLLLPLAGIDLEQSTSNLLFQ